MGWALFLFLNASGCATLPAAFDRGITADRVAQKSGFTASTVLTNPFLLKAYHRIRQTGKPLTVYIEGDGAAWVSKSRLSYDPTPRSLLVLQLAAEDPSSSVVYLARPCQYVPLDRGSACDSSYWSDKRFSETVIHSMNQAVDTFRAKAGAEEIHLVGYSGGAAVAVLIAARRSDVRTLRTIAGHLDSGALARLHGTTPLTGFLDPVEAAPLVATIPQIHFVGEKDEVTPPFIAGSFRDRTRGGPCVRVLSVEGAAHTTGWRERWADLVTIPVVCREDN